MKNAGKHAENLKHLFRRLMRDGKPDPKPTLEPLEALVKGAMSYDVSDSRAEEACRVITREFVDLNELRVATDLEIQELLGVKYPEIEKRVEMITKGMNLIFEKEHTLSLDRFKAVNKREARQFIKALPEMHAFVEAYIMMFAFDSGAVPVDSEILQYLVDNEVVDADATVEDAQKFVENHLKSEEMYEFFVVVRRASHRKTKA